MRDKWHVELTCDNCGVKFECVHKDRLNRKHNFCCKKCEGEFQKREHLNCTCPICGIRFHKKPYELAKAKHKLCCSRECLKEYRHIVYQ